VRRVCAGSDVRAAAGGRESAGQIDERSDQEGARGGIPAQRGVGAVTIEHYELYRPCDVAAATGISVASVYRLIRDGRLGHFQVASAAGAIRIGGIHVERLLAKHLDELTAAVR
jgi:Helix-turn-helix domain